MKIVQKNAKCRSCFWIFNSKFVLNTPLVVQTPSEMEIKGIRVRYADFMTLQSTFKGTVDMN